MGAAGSFVRALGLLPWVMAAASAQTANFYVSPQGSDANPGTAAKPFASLTKARDAVRKVNGSMTADLQVAILPGDYTVEQPIKFGERDSGMNGHKVIYRVQGAPGSAHFLGALRVTQWTAAGNGIFKSHVGKTYLFSTLYEDGIRADMARSPNRNSTFPVSRGPYFTIVRSGGDAGGDFLEYDPAQFDPKGKDLSIAQIYCWQDGDNHAWISTTGPVKAVDAVAHRIYTSGGRLATGAPNRFVIQNSFDLLDAPGEFFFDAKTGDLYYKPRHGSVESHVILAPRTREIVHLEGSSEKKPVHDIAFDGLDIEGSDAVFPHHADWDEKADNQNLAAMTITLAEKITVSNTRFHAIGMSAISLLDYAQGIVIHGCLIEHAGIHGVLLQGRLNTGDVNRGNEVSSCRIRYVGELAGYAADIHVLNSGHNLIEHDELSDSPRYALAFRTTTQHDVTDPSYETANAFSYLKVFGAGQDSGDAGAIYNVNFENGFNTLEQAAIFDNYADPSMLDKKPNGVYDDRDSGNTVYRNVMSWDNEWFPYRQDPDPRPAKFENVNWVRGFDIAKMEWNKIGLDGGFPTAFRTQNDIMIDDADSQIRYAGNWADLGLIPQNTLTATATSQDGEYNASKAIDGDPTTKWQSPSHPQKAPLPQSIMLDLHGLHTISKVKYLPWQDGLYVTPHEIWEGDTTGRFLSYTVYTSMDGKDFTEAVSGTWANTRAEKFATFAPVQAAYVQLEASAGSKDMASAGEINVYEARSTVGLYKSTLTSSSHKGDTAAFTFFGGSVRWLGPKGPEFGIADVYIDGKLAAKGIDCYAASHRNQQPLFTVNGLSADSSHTISVVVQGTHGKSSSGELVGVDLFVYNEKVSQ